MPRQQSDFGLTWWARQWLSALEGFGEQYASRLARGRTYARRGDVLRLAIQPGEAVALVQGSYMESYKVRLRLAVFPDAVWTVALNLLADQAAVAARLLSRELPRELETLFEELGVSLFPTTSRELATSCTCPDWAPICKHVAATVYVLAERMGADPFILLALRGRDEAAIGEALRTHWSGRRDEAAHHTATGAETNAEAGPSPTAPLEVAGFFEAGADLDEFTVTFAPPRVEAALLARIGKPPFAAEDEDVLTPLTEAYAAVTRRALNTLKRAGIRPPLDDDRRE